MREHLLDDAEDGSVGLPLVHEALDHVPQCGRPAALAENDVRLRPAAGEPDERERGQDQKRAADFDRTTTRKSAPSPRLRKNIKASSQA